MNAAGRGAPPARPDELAKRWLVALILDRPLEGAVALPVARLAREAPALCEQLLAALESEAALAELQAAEPREAPAQRGSVAAELAGIVGAHDAASLAKAVEALRGVLWAELRVDAEQRSAREAGEIAERLAAVCAAALARALEALEAGREDRAAPATAYAQHAAARPALLDEPRPGHRHGDHGGARRGTATIVDEGAAADVVAQARMPPPPEPSAPARAPRPPGAAPGAAPPGAAPSAPPSPGSGEIEIHDQRGEEGPAAWIGAIGGELERFERDGAPFAVLLVELAELERLRREVPAQALAALSARMEQALAGELERWAATITRERPGRCWVLVRGVDRAGVRALCELLSAAAGASHGGAPLRVAIGHALCPQDAREAAALAAHADVGLYAARAALRAADAGLSGGALEGR
ncbi:MAG TPA: hypothetical protein VL979_09840 [Solirubrobacteraceae bacterium]|nr:hypothetical protein [Solirubrobacteraceae bacterium]